MNIKRKLKYYIGIKDVFPQFLQAYFDRMTVRQKIIFYNNLKNDLTDEQKKVLLNDLNLDLSIIEESNKSVEEFRYILVGNIIDKHYYGKNKEIRSGTKHFRAGAKVYLLPEYGGNGHMHIPVYGLPRKSHKKILVVIRESMIKEVRVKKTFDPKLIAQIDDNFFYDNFNNDLNALEIQANCINENKKDSSIEIMDGTENNNH